MCLSRPIVTKSKLILLWPICCPREQSSFAVLHPSLEPAPKFLGTTSYHLPKKNLREESSWVTSGYMNSGAEPHPWKTRGGHVPQSRKVMWQYLHPCCGVLPVAGSGAAEASRHVALGHSMHQKLQNNGASTFTSWWAVDFLKSL